MPITIDPKVVEAELREQAVRRKEDPQRFAVAAAAGLRAVEHRADGITDDESRELLIVSALENLVPRLLKENKDSASYLFFMVLAALVWMAAKDKALWPTVGTPGTTQPQDEPSEETASASAPVPSPPETPRFAPRLRVLAPDEARRRNAASTTHLEAQLAEAGEATPEEVATAETEWRTFEQSMNETRRAHGEHPLYKEDAEP